MYPLTLYAATGGSVTADDAHHHKALGPGWSENPPEPIAASELELEPAADSTPAPKADAPAAEAPAADAPAADAPEAKKTRKKS